MLRLRLALALALATSGCSIIFNTDELPDIQVDAPTDASTIDTPVDAPTDANASSLTLVGVTPTTLDEGVGTGGGRPALLVIEASDLLSEATIDLAWEPDDPGTPIALAQPAAVSGPGGHIALALAIPEIGALAEGQMKTLRIGVTQTGAARKTIDVIVRGHDPLTLTGAIVATDARFETQTYSSITVTGTTTVTGARRLRLASYGPITINAAINVAAPNAGGCAGGAAQTMANCGPSGGGPGAQGPALGTGGGGGGGGFGTGGGAASGTGGDTRGNEMLVPMMGTVNRGSGGGGGGNPGLGLGGMGGAGGAGGGGVELRAGGAIIVGAAGRVNVNGVAGAVASSAGGGGGSGGAILVHAGAPIEYPPPGTPIAWLSARGAGAVGNGGAGGDGRIRVDDPSGAISTVGDPAPVGAPAWQLASTPPIVRDPTLMAMGRGPVGCFAVLPMPAPPADLCGNSDRQLGPGGVPIRFALTVGVNTVCLGWTTGSMLGPLLPEATNCVDVAYVPQ